MSQFRAANAIMETAGRDGLLDAIARVLDDPGRASAMGKAAQDVVRRRQGATARHVELILRHLPTPKSQ
jgi:hypothetical protein